ncbi:hypothetical protein C8F01DRAFT_481024 [Mycena amicta]|nr:hypothetical protein C8F01DRAFT_481024 [Mycena amicta]
MLADEHTWPQPLSPEERGGYYQWFLKNLHVFAPPSQALVPLSPNHRCAACGAVAEKRCGKCKKMWYCSAECQKTDWKAKHRLACNPEKPISCADRLQAAVQQHKLPEDVHTRESFGFERVDVVGEQLLADMYCVVLDEGVHPADLQSWKDQGVLLQEVERLLGRIEGWKTYRFMSWLKSHRYALDPSIPAPSDQSKTEETMNVVKTAYLKLWNSIMTSRPCKNMEDLHPAMQQLNWSEQDVGFFIFLAHLETIGHPNPIQDTWIWLGFCTCHDVVEERHLALTYKILAQRCSYDEFLAAFRALKIIELIDSKGLRSRRLMHPYLADILQRETVFGNKSVWDLKQHIVLGSESARESLPTPVWADYGFVNCKSDAEYEELKQVYTTIFERKDANPLELHKACIGGKLCEHAIGLFPELKKKKTNLQRLMKNMYPLSDL